MTVGVVGLIQSGGFGGFSKAYGLAAAGLLEAEAVTADGAVRIANACTNPDLFWALTGGGGGSFGVVTRLTLRTRELPEYFGGVFGTIKANSEAAFRRAAIAINRSMDELLKVVTHPGSYVSESDFFERAWQQSFWGSNYPRLAAVKKRYDPSGLFFVRHGVGSEDWSTDGFTRLEGS
jgi:FAD/FMN-containing dehydrogenase